jgi:hypothetical protein
MPPMPLRYKPRSTPACNPRRVRERYGRRQLPAPVLSNVKDSGGSVPAAADFTVHVAPDLYASIAAGELHEAGAVLWARLGVCLRGGCGCRRCR